jgi:hypothetical protein
MSLLVELLEREDTSQLVEGIKSSLENILCDAENFPLNEAEGIPDPEPTDKLGKAMEDIQVRLREMLESFGDVEKRLKSFRKNENNTSTEERDTLTRKLGVLSNDINVLQSSLTNLNKCVDRRKRTSGKQLDHTIDKFGRQRVADILHLASDAAKAEKDPDDKSAAFKKGNLQRLSSEDGKGNLTPTAEENAAIIRALLRSGYLAQDDIRSPLHITTKGENALTSKLPTRKGSNEKEKMKLPRNAGKKARHWSDKLGDNPEGVPVSKARMKDYPDDLDAPSDVDKEERGRQADARDEWKQKRDDLRALRNVKKPKLFKGLDYKYHDLDK